MPYNTFSLPFDGMNERGLAIGMAAVPPGDMETDPNKPTIDELAVMREILDHAASVDEAINLLSSYNIVMSTIPLHYLVASAAGESALIEFYQGKMIVYRNEEPWQIATNFLVASTGGKPEGQCPRFDRIARELQAAEGRLNNAEAIQLLSDVSQAAPASEAPTQWSVVYDLSSGDITIVMGRKYSNEAHKLHLDLVGS